MSPEDELLQFKKKVRRDGRITNVILAIASILSVLSMVYGVVKTIEANTKREAAEMKIYDLKVELQKCQSERK